jgi:MFS family permease
VKECVQEGLQEALPRAASREPRAIHAGILLVTSGLTTLVTAVIGPSLPKMQAHFAAVRDVDFLVPLTMTVPMLVMAVLSIVMGTLADRIGRKRILVSSTALYAVFGTAPLWLPTLGSIFASRVALGITEAALMTVSTTMIGDYFPRSRCQKFMALQTTVASSSAFCLNLLGGVIGEFGWRAPYTVYAISIPLAFMMAAYLWEPKPAAGTSGACAHVPDEAGVMFQPRRLCGICVLAAYVGLVFLIVPVHLGYLFGALGTHSTAAIGLAYGLNSLGVVAGTLCFGWIIAHRLTVPGQLALAALVTAAGFAGMALAGSYATLTAAAVLNGLGSGLLLPTAVTWNMRELPFSRRGLGVGAFQSSLFLGMFANPILVVSLERMLGTRAAAVGAVGAGLAATGVVALVVAIRNRGSVTRS